VPLTWHAELAWLGGDREQVDEGVTIVIEGERIASVEVGVPPPAAAVRLPGLVLPALANAHSHAFHRALRGRTHAAGDFWSWREEMYALAARLEPDTYHDLARAVYAEMALAGVAAVGEFHYLHHAPGGRRYADPNAFGHALAAAGVAAGVRLTLLDTCYLQADVDSSPLQGVQLRFGDGSAAAWAERVDALAAEVDGPASGVGAAIHSVRAVPPAAMAAVAAWAGERGVPLHLHLSEQPQENQACLAVSGRTPARLCAETGVLGDRTTAVHATHLGDEDIALLGRSGTTACLCPTTERDLADGIGPGRRLAAAGCPLALGSDSHAVVDLFEEARAVELDERLASGRRGRHHPADLLRAATRGGMRSLGWDGGVIEAGRLADLVALRLDSPRLAGARRDQLLAAVVFAAAATDVTDLVVGGRQVVSEGRHLLVPDVPTALARSIVALDDRPWPWGREPAPAPTSPT
jgi:formiminoglutamate deiminase